MQAGEPTAGYPGAALFQSADWLCCVQASEPTDILGLLCSSQLIVCCWVLAGEPTAGYPGAALFQSAEWPCCVQASEPTVVYPGAALF